jgi:6-phosphogluconolactonase
MRGIKRMGCGSKSIQADIQVYSDPESLAEATARHILAVCSAAIQARGFASLVLSGGSTPRAIYSLLSQDEYAIRMDWQNLHIFWGDERQVPSEDADSNYRMAWEAMLSKVPIPAGNIHRIQGELEAQLAAQKYEHEIEDFFHEERQRVRQAEFDLLLLGLGEDGHVASLFPGSPALQEKTRRVVPVEHNGPPLPAVPRISLTLPAINSAAKVTFIVSGAGKAQIVRRVFDEEASAECLPAQMVQPVKGHVSWLLEKILGSLEAHW